MKPKFRIIVSGLIAQYPLGGVTWDYLQYVLGLVQLGHDVYYLEDTGLWPYNPLEGGISEGCIFNVNYLSKVMKHYGLGDKWAYRFPWQSQWFGLPDQEREKVINSADLLINVSCSLQNIVEYRRVKRLVYIDTDPVFTQIKLAKGQKDFRNYVNMHDVCFSYGECLSESGPATEHRWLPLRKPIVLSEWRSSTSHRDVFTTVMNWTSFKNINYQGRSYGQKDIEFMKFLDLPSMVKPTILEMAMGSGKTRQIPRELLLHKGWKLENPLEVCLDFEGYRHYIESSKAEWTVAKNGYVQGQAGWFSGRSACYLAAGRPVIVQDTGFASVIPVGEGVLIFRTLEEAANAIKEVNVNYQRHTEAARDIAEEYFDSAKVLKKLVNQSMG